MGCERFSPDRESVSSFLRGLADSVDEGKLVVTNVNLHTVTDDGIGQHVKLVWNPEIEFLAVDDSVEEVVGMLVRLLGDE